jgi:hypothetical protein
MLSKYSARFSFDSADHAGNAVKALVTALLTSTSDIISDAKFLVVK